MGKRAGREGKKEGKKGEKSTRRAINKKKRKKERKKESIGEERKERKGRKKNQMIRKTLFLFHSPSFGPPMKRRENKIYRDGEKEHYHGKKMLRGKKGAVLGRKGSLYPFMYMGRKKKR